MVKHQYTGKGVLADVIAMNKPPVLFQQWLVLHIGRIHPVTTFKANAEERSLCKRFMVPAYNKVQLIYIYLFLKLIPIIK